MTREPKRITEQDAFCLELEAIGHEIMEAEPLRALERIKRLLVSLNGELRPFLHKPRYFAPGSSHKHAQTGPSTRPRTPGRGSRPRAQQQSKTVEACGHRANFMGL